jgi:hypothetical protein
MHSSSFRSSALLATLFVGAALMPLSLRAQQGAVADRTNDAAQVATPAPVAAADAAPAAGPRAVPAGITKPSQANPLGLAEPQGAQGPHMGAGSNLALMGVGAAALVVGLLIGGSGGYIIAVGGGVVGLVGLYRYLK